MLCITSSLRDSTHRKKISSCGGNTTRDSRGKSGGTLLCLACRKSFKRSLNLLCCWNNHKCGILLRCGMLHACSTAEKVHSSIATLEPGGLFPSPHHGTSPDGHLAPAPSGSHSQPNGQWQDPFEPRVDILHELLRRKLAVFAAGTRTCACMQSNPGSGSSRHCSCWHRVPLQELWAAEAPEPKTNAWWFVSAGHRQLLQGCDRHGAWYPRCSGPSGLPKAASYSWFPCLCLMAIDSSH